MDLCVIIVSYNVKEYLRQCIFSVRIASEKIDCEIIIVDNNSSDGSAEMTETEFPEVKLIRNNVNIGFSAANNQAINLSKANYILLLNPDTIVGKDSFSMCLEFMKNKKDAGALGVRMVDGNGKFLPESKRAFPTPLTAFFKITGLNRGFPQSAAINKYYLPVIDSFETSEVEVLAGAFMMLTHEALTKVGLLDEEFFMYGEDIDLSYRILKAGYKNYYYPDVEIIHFKGKSTPENGFSDILHFYSAMRIYARKRNIEKSSFLYPLIISAIWFIESIKIILRFFRIRFAFK